MMEVNYKVTGEDRKRLVEAISEITGENFDYLRLPINAYTIGGFTVDRTGTLSCERDGDGEKVRSLAEKLAERGFIAESEDEWETQEEQTQFTAMENEETTENPNSDSEEETAEAVTTEVADDAPLDAPSAGNVDAEAEEDATAEEPEDAETTVTIEVSREGFTFTAIENLQRLVDSKETLIKQALGVDRLPIELQEDRISFPWFAGQLDAEHVTAYTLFIERLCQRAKKATRIYGVENPTDNPRFSFRTFLVRLGMNGAAYGNARRILMENLPGSSAWKDGGKAENGLSDTIREQILELKNGREVNLFDDSAVQDAASRSGFRELALYLENHRGKPRTEYVSFLLGEVEQE